MVDQSWVGGMRTVGSDGASVVKDCGVKHKKGGDLNIKRSSVTRSLLMNRGRWSLTVYCPKLRLCLMRMKHRTAEMTVWVRVKRRRDAFTPRLIFCW